MAVKALETLYKGYSFRSRLEARWAVFFDTLGMDWLYEHQGFDVNGRWYLPDFYLPQIQAYAEVKPTLFTPIAFTLATAVRAILLDGPPDVKLYSMGNNCGSCGLSDYGCYCAGHEYYRVHLPRSLYKGRCWFNFGEGIEAYDVMDFLGAVEAARGARFERRGRPDQWLLDRRHNL